MSRTPGGDRVVALMPVSDVECLTLLTGGDRPPIGPPGTISQGTDGLLAFRFG